MPTMGSLCFGWKSRVLGKKADIVGFVSKSNSPDISAEDHAFQLKANYNWDGWRLSAGYTEVGEGFNPEVGF